MSKLNLTPEQEAEALFIRPHYSYGQFERPKWEVVELQDGPPKPGAELYTHPPRAQAVPEPVADQWLIQMRGDYLVTRGVWERPDHRGYTNDINEAGRYSEDEAKEAERMMPQKCKAVHLPLPAQPEGDGWVKCHIETAAIALEALEFYARERFKGFGDDPEPYEHHLAQQAISELQELVPQPPQEDSDDGRYKPT
jgi:hypothetical protein